MEDENNYKKWLELHKALNALDFSLPFNEREIWWVSMGLNVGIEINGKGENFERPAIIIKKFNKDHVWIIPINSSTSTKEGLCIPLSHYGLHHTSAAIISQLQRFSTRRLVSLIGILSPDQFVQILEAVIKILPLYTKDLDKPGPLL
jgi:mRNA interferase MazF